MRPGAMGLFVIGIEVAGIEKEPGGWLVVRLMVIEMVRYG